MEGNGNIYFTTGGNENVFIYYDGNGMGMGIQSWKWGGMGSKKSFLHISTREYFAYVLQLVK